MQETRARSTRAREGKSTHRESFEGRHGRDEDEVDQAVVGICGGEEHDLRAAATEEEGEEEREERQHALERVQRGGNEGERLTSLETNGTLPA